MAYNNAEPTERSKSGPDVASLNAPLPPQPRREGEAPGARGRDAGEGAGIESGLSMKERFETRDPEEGLGKPICPMGTPPWEDPPEEQVGESVQDTFGAGQRHTIKNG